MCVKSCLPGPCYDLCLLVPVAVVIIVRVVVAGVVIGVQVPNSCSIQTCKKDAIKASDKTRPTQYNSICYLIVNHAGGFAMLAASSQRDADAQSFLVYGFPSVYGKCHFWIVHHTGAWGCSAMPGFAGRQRLGGSQGQPQ